MFKSKKASKGKTNLDDPEGEAATQQLNDNPQAGEEDDYEEVRISCLTWYSKS